MSPPLREASGPRELPVELKASRPRKLAPQIEVAPPPCLGNAIYQRRRIPRERFLISRSLFELLIHLEASTAFAFPRNLSSFGGSLPLFSTPLAPWSPPNHSPYCPAPFVYPATPSSSPNTHCGPSPCPDSEVVFILISPCCSIVSERAILKDSYR